MSTKKTEKTTVPEIIITGGMHRYLVSLAEISQFMDTISEQLEIDNLEDLTVELENIADYALEGAPDHLPASTIKKPMKLMREVIFFFQAFLLEAKD